MLAGCASFPLPPTALMAANDQLIVLENSSGPFCGRCDHLKITALSNGRVWIEQGYWAGFYRDWRVKRRLVQTSPERFADFREALRPHRPKGQLALNGMPPCKTFMHDTSGVRVEWKDDTGSDELILVFGCDRETTRTMADAIIAAPGLLGIVALKMP